MTHKLKTWPKYFQAVKNGTKKFEVRKNDRIFNVGDRLLLEEYDNIKQEYTGDQIEVTVDYILHGPAFGVENDYCVMSITP